MKNYSYSTLKFTFGFALLLSIVLFGRTYDNGSQQSNLVEVGLKVRFASACANYVNSDNTIDVISKEERKNAIDFMNSMKGSAEFGLDQTLEGKSLNQQKLIDALIQTALVWAIFFALSLIGWWYYYICCMCDSCCPPCQSCRRNLEEKPYSSKELLVPMGFAIVFNMIVMSAAIAGLVYSPGISKGLEVTKCAITNSFYQIIYNKDGLDSVAIKIQNYLADLDSLMVELDNVFQEPPTNNYKDYNTQLVTDIDGTARIVNYPDGIEGVYSNKKLFYYMVTEDPTSAADYKTTSDELQTSISDIASRKFNLPEILNLQTRIKSEAATAMEITGQEFQTSGSKTTLEQGQQKSSQTILDLDTSSSSIVANLDFLNMVSDMLNLIFTILFSVCIAISVLCTLVIILIQLKKIYCLRVCIHFTWCLYCLIMVIGFLIGTIIHPVVLGMSEVCVYLESYFDPADQSFFNSHNLIKTGTSKEIIARCIWGDQNLYSYLNIDGALTSLNKLITAMGDFQLYQDELSSNGVTDENIQNKFQSNIDLLESIITDGLSDSSYSQSDRESTWRPIINSINSFKLRRTAESVDMNNYLDSINTFTSSFKDKLSNNPIRGAVNCGYIGDMLMQFFDGICAVFTPNLYRTMIIILLISVTMFIGSLANCCVGVRFARISNSQQLVQPDNNAKQSLQQSGDLELGKLKGQQEGQMIA